LISFRYHVVSIVAVFLALALGVVVGTTALNGPITTNLRQQVDSLKKDRSSLASQNKTLTNAANNSDDFAATFGAQIVAGTLKNKKILVLEMPNASSSIKSGVIKELGAAGATVTAQIQVTSDFTNPQRADDIRSLTSGPNAVHPIGLTLPSTDDPGSLGGALLGYVLLSGQAQQTDLASVLEAFSKLQMIKVETNNPSAADLAVVISSGPVAVGDLGGKTQLSMLTAIQSAGGSTILAGDNGSSTAGGLIAQVRGSDVLKSSLSTVDDADTAMGQVSTVLALAEAQTGQTGAFGNGAGAQAAFPNPISH
jgi:hypothetical protein